MLSQLFVVVFQVVSELFEVEMDFPDRKLPTAIKA